MSSSRIPDRDVRIGLLIPSLEYGGAQRALLALAVGLLERGYSLRLLLIDDVRAIDLPGTEAQKLLLNRSIRVLGGGFSWTRYLGTIGKIIGMAINVRRLKVVAKEDQLSIVISFLERANLLSLMALEGVPRIISVRKHMEMALAEKSWIKSSLIRIAYPLLVRQADAVVCNSSESAKSFARKFPQTRAPIVTILNSVSPTIVGAATEPIVDANELDGRPVVVAVGRLKPAKGFVPLLRAFSLVHARVSDAVLVIVGDGPEREKLERVASALGIREHVRLKGLQANPYPWLARGTLFVLPSRAEGFPNALLEAMALGVPVIAADCPSGPREILAPDTPSDSAATRLEPARYGILAPRMPPMDLSIDAELWPSEVALADGMVQLLCDKALRDRYRDAAKVGAARFGPSETVRRWGELIHWVLAK